VLPCCAGLFSTVIERGRDAGLSLVIPLMSEWRQARRSFWRVTSRCWCVAITEDKRVSLFITNQAFGA
jgi:hypothetical protein